MKIKIFGADGKLMSEDATVNKETVPETPEVESEVDEQTTVDGDAAEPDVSEYDIGDVIDGYEPDDEDDVPADEDDEVDVDGEHDGETGDEDEEVLDVEDDVVPRSDYDELAAKYEEMCSSYEQLETEHAILSNRHATFQKDWDNYRRRTEESLELEKANASKKLVTAILPSLDDFERAIEHAHKTGAGEEVVSGMMAIYKKLVSILEKEGVKQVRGKGQKFDIETQQAIERREGTDMEPDMVAEVYQTGYIMNGIVIRPALVAVTV